MTLKMKFFEGQYFVFWELFPLHWRFANRTTLQWTNIIFFCIMVIFALKFFHAGWWVYVWFIKQFRFNRLWWGARWSLWQNKKVILMKGKSISLSVACSHSTLMLFSLMVSDNDYDVHQDISLSAMIQQSWSNKHQLEHDYATMCWVLPSCLKLGMMLLKDWIAI